jgi:hypothetical protein
MRMFILGLIGIASFSGGVLGFSSNDEMNQRVVIPPMTPTVTVTAPVVTDTMPEHEDNPPSRWGTSPTPTLPCPVTLNCGKEMV